MEKLADILFIPFIILLYCSPLILGLLAVWVYRTFIGKESYSRDFISGLIMLCAAREFFRNLRFRKK